MQWNGIAPNRPPGAPPGFGPLGRNVGFDTSSDSTGTSLLDTQLHANSNAGHLWGTQLSDAEKWDLIEYMKSL